MLRLPIYLSYIDEAFPGILVLLDKVINLRQYIMQYTVGNSLTSLIMLHFVG